MQISSTTTSIPQNYATNTQSLLSEREALVAELQSIQANQEMDSDLKESQIQSIQSQIDQIDAQIELENNKQTSTNINSTNLATESAEQDGVIISNSLQKLINANKNGDLEKEASKFKASTDELYNSSGYIYR